MLRRLLVIGGPQLYTRAYVCICTARGSAIHTDYIACGKTNKRIQFQTKKLRRGATIKLVMGMAIEQLSPAFINHVSAGIC